MYVWIYWRYFYRVLSSMLDVSTRWNPCCRKFKTTGINPIRNWTTSWNISVTASVKPPERQKHDHAPPPRARTRLHKFHSVGNSNQHVPVQCNNDLKQQRDRRRWNLKKRQITSCLGRTGQHARPSRKHCKPCAKHAHAPPPRARTRLYKFHSVGNLHQSVPVQWTTTCNK